MKVTKREIKIILDVLNEKYSQLNNDGDSINLYSDSFHKELPKMFSIKANNMDEAVVLYPVFNKIDVNSFFDPKRIEHFRYYLNVDLVKNKFFADVQASFEIIDIDLFLRHYGNK